MQSEVGREHSLGSKCGKNFRCKVQPGGGRGDCDLALRIGVDRLIAVAIEGGGGRGESGSVVSLDVGRQRNFADAISQSRD